MKSLKLVLSFLLLAIFTLNLSAQDAKKNTDKKEHKKVVIIKKTIDEDGKEHIEKIVKEGDEVSDFIWIDQDGNDFEFSKDFRFEFKDHDENGVHFFSGDDTKDVQIIKIEDLDDLPEEVQKKLDELDIDIENMDGSDHKIIRLRSNSDGEDENVVIDLDFDFDQDIPEDVMEELKAKGIQLHSHTKDFKFGHTNKAFLGVMVGQTKEVENIDGEETVTINGGSDEGALVIGITEGSAAEAAGLQKDDILTAFDGNTVLSFEDVVSQLGNYEVGDQVKIDYLRNGKATQTTATLGEREAKSVNGFFFEKSEEDGEGNTFHFDTDFDFDLFPHINVECDVIVEEDEDGENNFHSKKIIIIKKRKDGETPEVEVIEREEPVVETTPQNNTLELDGMNAFPNPTDGLLQVQFKAAAVPTIVKITDISGKEIYQEDLKDFDGAYNNQIDVRNEANGTLLLTISQGKKVFTEQIVLDK